MVSRAADHRCHRRCKCCRVGQVLLRGQWREAVRLLLTPRADCGRPDQAEACRLYLEKGDVEGALRKMPRFLVTEPALLQVGGQLGAERGGRVGRHHQDSLWQRPWQLMCIPWQPHPVLRAARCVLRHCLAPAPAGPAAPAQ